MVKTVRLSKEFITRLGHKGPHPYGSAVEKRSIEGIDEIQYLDVTPWTAIKKHGHDNQWEVWIWLSHKIAYVCLKDEEHELINNSGIPIQIMAIKGHLDYSYDDLWYLLNAWGFSVTHGSLIVA